MAEYSAWTVTGVVTGLKAWSEPDTNETGEGGGDARASIHIASRMSQKQTFAIRQRDGREIEIALADSGLTLKNGHVITAVWVARKGMKHGFCVLADNHTTGDQIRIPDNLKLIQPKVGLTRTAKFGLFATFPALLAMALWLLVPGSLESGNIGTFVVVASVAVIMLFGVGLIVSKLVLDYLQADDHQKIWQAAQDASEEILTSMHRAPPNLRP